MPMFFSCAKYLNLIDLVYSLIKNFPAPNSWRIYTKKWRLSSGGANFFKIMEHLTTFFFEGIEKTEVAIAQLPYAIDFTLSGVL